MELKARRLTLRPVNKADLLTLKRWRNSYVYLASCTTSAKPLGLVDIKRQSEKRLVQFMVVHETKGVIGTIFSNRVDLEQGHLFLTTYLDAKFRNSGHGPVALTLAIKYCFASLPISVIYFDVFVSSDNSLACFMGGLTRLGFRKGRSFKEYRGLDRKYVETVRFSFRRESQYLLAKLTGHS